MREDAVTDQERMNRLFPETDFTAVALNISYLLPLTSDSRVPV